jgi:hypothetical protein
MAIAIKDIPVLTGSVAREFVRRAEIASKNRRSKDLRKQAHITKLILEKAGYITVDEYFSKLKVIVGQKY